MIFTEGRFFVLFAACFCIYWAMSSARRRKLWLLTCSCIFYGAWDVRFLGLMFVTIALDYVIGLMLGRDPVPGGRRLWLAISIAGNLGILGFFKYFNFFARSAAELARACGIELSPATLEIVLPVGVSFYTFQSMSYTIDVYRKQMATEKNFLNFALFVTFFPQLVAGPIVRAIEFLPQLVEKRAWKNVNVRASLTLFLIGYFKKACIADNVSGTVDRVFSGPHEWSALSNWTAVVMYSIQIYCDFSGYSDMAIALAGLLGYKLTLNFDFPYLAKNIGEFWRRWHISLSTWFRDYLYIPLGGNRRSPARVYLNLFLVFFLCGLWHGASWNFVAWGLMHGAFLTIHRIWTRTVKPESAAASVASSIGPALTALCVLIAWVVFRGANFERTWTMLGILCGARAGGGATVSGSWWILIAGCALVHVASRRKIFAPIERAAPDWAFALGFGAAVALVLPWVATGYQPFIYFQF